MTRVGVTGHMNLSVDTADMIRSAIREHLTEYSRESLVGISCIARGADSIFADVILELGASLEVFLPSEDYRKSKVPPDHVQQFDRLLSRAAGVHTMPFVHANRQAYAAANAALLDSCDALVAIWDGQFPADQGGTGSVVKEARSRGLRVDVIWPEGASRV